MLMSTPNNHRAIAGRRGADLGKCVWGRSALRKRA